MAYCAICHKKIKGIQEMYRTGEPLCETCASNLYLCPRCSCRFEDEYMFVGFCQKCTEESDD